jgi:hypothetical protein
MEVGQPIFRPPEVGVCLGIARIEVDRFLVGLDGLEHSAFRSLVTELPAQ